MKCLNILQWLPMVAVGAFFYGCQQVEDAQWSDDEYGTLKVETRTVENVEVPYPMSLYAFSSSGDCVDTQTIEDADEKQDHGIPDHCVAVSPLIGQFSDCRCGKDVDEGTNSEQESHGCC